SPRAPLRGTRPTYVGPGPASFQDQTDADPATLFRIARSRCGARDGLAEDFDGAEVNIPAGAVAAAGHQVGEADFVDLGEIGIGDPDVIVRGCGTATTSGVVGHDAHRIELDPADIGQRELLRDQ